MVFLCVCRFLIRAKVWTPGQSGGVITIRSESVAVEEKEETGERDSMWGSL